MGTIINYKMPFPFIQISSQSDLPSNAVRILETLIQYLVIEHIDYAVELGLQGETSTHFKPMTSLMFLCEPT